MPDHLPILKTVKKYLDDVPSTSATSWYCDKKKKKTLGTGNDTLLLYCVVHT